MAVIERGVGETPWCTLLVSGTSPRRTTSKAVFCCLGLKSPKALGLPFPIPAACTQNPTPLWAVGGAGTDRRIQEEHPQRTPSQADGILWAMPMQSRKHRSSDSTQGPVPACPRAGGGATGRFAHMQKTGQGANGTGASKSCLRSAEMLSGQVQSSKLEIKKNQGSSA